MFLRSFTYIVFVCTTMDFLPEIRWSENFCQSYQPTQTSFFFFFFWCLHRELTVNINQHTTDQAYHKHVTNSLWMNAFIVYMNLDFIWAFYSWSILTFTEFIPLAQNKAYLVQVHSQIFFLVCGLHNSLLLKCLSFAFDWLYIIKTQRGLQVFPSKMMCLNRWTLGCLRL